MKKGSKHKQSVKDRISKSLMGHCNNELWTKELVTEILNAMCETLSEEYEVEVKIKDDQGISGENIIEKKSTEKIKRRHHLKEKLLVLYKIKNAKWFARMKEKFHSEETILHLLEWIDMACMVNTHEDAANNVTNATISKMHLSHHYGWKDTSGLDISDNRAKSDEQLDKELEEYEKRNKK